MTRVKGPNGAVVTVSDGLAKSLVGDGTRGCSVVPELREPEVAAKPVARKRTPRKPTTK